MPNHYGGLPVGPLGVLGGALVNPGQQSGGAAPPPELSFWDKLLGGVGGALGGPGASLLDPEGLRSAGRQGLLSAGASLLQGMTPTTQPRSFLGDLGTALTAGQAGAAAGAEGELGVQQVERQREYERELQEATARGASDEELLALHQKYNNVGMAQVMASRISARKPSRITALNPETEKIEYGMLNPVTGEIEFTGIVAPAQVGADRLERAAANRIAQQGVTWRRQKTKQYNQATKTVQEAHSGIVTAMQAFDALEAGADPTDAITKVNLLYAFIKAIDPGSVVRASEVALVEGALAMKDKFSRVFDDILRGKSGAIPDSVIAELRTTFTRLRDGLERNIRRRHGEMIDAAIGEGYYEDFERVFPNIDYLERPEVDPDLLDAGEAGGGLPVGIAPGGAPMSAIDQAIAQLIGGG